GGEGPAAVVAEMDDVDLVVYGGAVVRDDEALPGRVPGDVEGVAEAARKLLDGAVGEDTKDFAAVPVRKGGHEAAAVVADADEDRAVGGDAGVAAMVLRRRAARGEVDVRVEGMDDGLRAGVEVDGGDDVRDLHRRGVVDDGGVIVAQGHAEEPRIPDGNGVDVRNEPADATINPEQPPLGGGVVDRAARVDRDGARKA